MIDLLIIQHELDTPPGSTELWARSHNLSYHIWHIAKDPSHPFAPNEIKALVLCGGSMNVFEEERCPWLKIEKDFIKECLKLHKPIFGLCLGSQLLAEVLGGRVYPLHKWEVGFVPVNLLESSSKPILEVFHWHQCTFDLPPGATLLATNDFCPNQAFTWGDNVIATQFHPEALPAWIEQCAEDSLDRTYTGRIQTKKEMLDSIPLQEPLQQWFFKKLNSWFPFT